jgi:hypothetical protein
MCDHPFEYVRRFMIAGDQKVDGSNHQQAALYEELVREEVAEFWEGIVNKDDVEILDAICDSIWVLSGYAHSRGWDITGAYEEVARSNMSKVDGETGKLLKREDGKVLKPASFSPPNLEPFVKKDPVMPDYENIVMGLGEE